MNKTRTRFSRWALPILSVQQLVLLAALIALSFVLGRVSITTQILRISFVFLASSLMGKWFGPIWSMLVMVLLDFVKTNFFGGGNWSPFMAIGVAIAGLIYGAFFYRENKEQKLSWWTIALAVLAITVIVNLLINTASIMLLYSSKHSWAVFNGMLAPRLLKSVIFYPIQLLLTYWVLNNRVVLDLSKRFFNQ
ncbi:folate family ECF transporter S component [Fructobacillus parabroussonetiae]|uniref:Folate family ECF transporter S component n=1 Tax=Fructobacillus parabroussonetiae TaxID=2713174 RepID=A0ABS5QVA8_9LACO|nr:folate family ECF transporter S component [Fructobacillus parabroussonetiae]MBS9337134.1 folate family ECF transporter S component [Fructobacillus parabroussonetiae]MCK8617927.1 folate family ECF transporter S component [Fructobacillus parabroussonetiae]